ncbi:MAG: YraN family protein [Firmicutes bacterium]|nr:YraN family protein [Bacillota bacterium]
MKGSGDGRLATGRAGEATALEYLTQKGYVLITRNYRCRLGEVDLIMKQGEKLAFIEVRSRSGEGFGLPQESVRAEKVARIQRIAQYFLSRELRGNWQGPVNLEMVAVRFGPGGTLKKIEHITDLS